MFTSQHFAVLRRRPQITRLVVILQSYDQICHRKRMRMVGEISRSDTIAKTGVSLADPLFIRARFLGIVTMEISFTLIFLFLSMHNLRISWSLTQVSTFLQRKIFMCLNPWLQDLINVYLLAHLSCKRLTRRTTSATSQAIHARAALPADFIAACLGMCVC